MKEVLYLALKEAVNDLASDNEIEIQISKPSNPQNGDWSSNIALLLSKKINKSPHDLAKKIIKTLKIKNKVLNYEKTSQNNNQYVLYIIHNMKKILCFLGLNFHYHAIHEKVQNHRSYYT